MFEDVIQDNWIVEKQPDTVYSYKRFSLRIGHQLREERWVIHYRITRSHCWRGFWARWHISPDHPWGEGIPFWQAELPPWTPVRITINPSMITREKRKTHYICFCTWCALEMLLELYSLALNLYHSYYRTVIGTKRMNILEAIFERIRPASRRLMRSPLELSLEIS